MIFWSFVLDFLGSYSIFFGQERSAPPRISGRYAYVVISAIHLINVVLACLLDPNLTKSDVNLSHSNIDNEVLL